VISVSPLFREAMAYPWTGASRVDVIRSGVVVAGNVPIESGKYTADRTSKIRLSVDVNIVEPPGEPIDIDIYTCRLRVYSGVTSLGHAEWIQLGEFRIDEIDRDESGSIAVKASGLEAYVIDDRFVQPRTPPWGASTVGEIEALIQESLPGQRVIRRGTRDLLVRATAPWDKERWDAIDALATTIDATVYVDHLGEFVITDAPQPGLWIPDPFGATTGTPVMTLDEGPGGVLVSRKEVDTRDQVYNAMSVYGDSSDPAVPPVFGWAYDDDPSSPTYYYGPFGKVTKFYSSSFFTTNAQCQSTAAAMLALALAPHSSLSFQAAPIPFLEVDDLVAVRTLSGNLEMHLLDKLDWDFGPGGELSVDTRSSKVAAREGAV
jgi:hypothetical protein